MNGEIEAGARESWDGSEIAIVGMAGRFPGACDLETFWRNLCAGVESIAPLSDDDLKASAVAPALLANPQYVKAAPILDDIESFDATFFGYSPREAEVMDPQQRLFLECTWEALEHAGYDPATYSGDIGVFGGARPSGYLLNLFSNRHVLASLDLTEVGLGNDLANMTTRVAYKLNLTGPSYSLHTACSTSLIAVHLACQSLLLDECQMALAGSVAVFIPHKVGYLYQPGGIFSPDGHCRAFDADARGTLFGSGAGVVVLKRLEDALADGDHLHAIIRGSATNNDGAAKASFTAPGVDGQARVVAEALDMARVHPETITYVEAHGTGTTLGDSIEIRALTKAFRARTNKTGFCAVGSVKTNIGHLDTAAGMSSLIKTVLALEHKVLPPSLHCRTPNPLIDFAHSPFYVNTGLVEWEAAAGLPRRAGVSAFGFGSANAHIILEEAPASEPSSASRRWQLLMLSAKTATALASAGANLAAYLEQQPALNLADAAYTLQIGRRAFAHRRVVVCETIDDAVTALKMPDQEHGTGAVRASRQRAVVFMFPGQGAQHVGMAAELYRSEPFFREQVDRCAELLKPHLGLDVREVLYPDLKIEDRRSRIEDSASSILHPLSSILDLDETWLTQPALFVVEYALARLWMHWGVRPHAMIGHSLGEYVAACLAGVCSLEDALALVAARGRLMQALPPGAMLAVALSEADLQPLLDAQLSVAAVNGPSACVVSGPPDAIAALEARLAGQGASSRRLHTAHAFHSPVVEASLAAFAEQVRSVKLQPPALPYVSNVTGTWATAADVTDPDYWARHLRRTVRFADGLQTLQRAGEDTFLEIGPGNTLSQLARRQPGVTPEHVILSSLPHPAQRESESKFLLATMGTLWQAGAAIDWRGFYAHEARRRIPLPTYPFERQRYWIEPDTPAQALGAQSSLDKKPDLADWFYLPSWKRSPLPASRQPEAPAEKSQRWLVFEDAYGLGAALARRLRAQRHEVVSVVAGPEFRRLDETRYAMHPQRPEDYRALLAELRRLDKRPERLVHLWNITPDEQPSFEYALSLSFYSLLFLSQALGEERGSAPLSMAVVSNHLHDVIGTESIQPEKSTLSGICRVIPLEQPQLNCRSIDVDFAAPGAERAEQLAGDLLAEVEAQPGDAVVAYRGPHRWVQVFEPIRLEAAASDGSGLRERGVYLITGGLGGVGLHMAGYLARTVQARLILVGRSAVPPRTEWERLDGHESRKIRALQELEALGSEVLCVSADVTDQAQMQSAITRGLERFGQIHGVIHAAGLPGAGLMQLKTVEAAERVLAPKLHGARVLEEIFRDTSLDFLVFFSSLSAVVGEAGQSDYCAANAFLDALAQRARRQGRHVLSINWDTWRETGMAADLGGPEAVLHIREQATAGGMLPAEGAAAFGRIISQPALTQVAVSLNDLRARIEYLRACIPALLSKPLPVSGPTHPRPPLPNPYVAPRSECEENVAAVWQALLGIDRVGVYDDFFQLGGHSLLVTHLLDRLQAVYPVEISLRRLFENPTVAGLAEFIERTEAEQNAPLLIRGRRESGVAPLSFAQQRLWFLDQLQPASPLYNLLVAVRLSGDLNVSALARSLNEIIRRHEVLRTIFKVHESEPVEVIVPALTLRLPFVDLAGLAGTTREAQLQDWFREAAQHPFDIARGPLVRAWLLRLDAAEHVLLLNTHHIICDGWSHGILIQECATLYEAFVNRRPSPLPDRPYQYADYAIWQRAWLQGPGVRGQGPDAPEEQRTKNIEQNREHHDQESGVRSQESEVDEGQTQNHGLSRVEGSKLKTQNSPLEAHLAYWRQQLADLPVLQLPSDHPRPAVQTSRGAQHTLALPGSLIEMLNTLSRREGVTLFMTLLAAFQVLLARYSGQTDIVVGSPIANRSRAELEGMIGLLVNVLVLRTDVSGNPTFRDVLRRVREVTLEAYAHQDLPFEQLVEALRPARDLSRPPLFQVMFAFQNAWLPDVAVPGLTLTPLEIDRGLAPFDLTVLVVEAPTELWVTLEYNTYLFDAASIRRMAGHFQVLLAGIAADPERRLADVPLLGEAERRQLLVEWNDTHTEFRSQESGVRSETACLHELFAAQAARTPDAVAVVFDGRPTTNDQRPTTTARGQGSGIRGQGAAAQTRLPPPAGGGTEGGSSQESGVRSQESEFLAPNPQSPIPNPQSTALSPQSSVLSPQSLTYSELNARANQLANYLQRLGVGPEVLVGVCVERSLELVIGLLGVLKAGGAYVPLDPAYPAERLAFMLEDSQAAVLITTTDQRPTTNDDRPTTNDDRPATSSEDRSTYGHDISSPNDDPRRPTIDPRRPATSSEDRSAYGHDISCPNDDPRRPTTIDLRPQSKIQNPKSKIVALDTDWPSIAIASPSNPTCRATPDNLAYVIYTSGSTGRPKGVAVSHRALVNFLLAMRHEPGLTEQDVLLAITTLSFDIAGLELYWPLLAGARLVLAPREVARDGRLVRLALLDYGATIMQATPASWRLLLEAGGLGGRPLKMLCGGEALPRELANELLRQADALWNLYGPTETTIWSTLARVVPGAGPPSIGRPIANTRLYILDANLQPTPVGIAGELYIGGAGLARGYLKRPDLTAEKFLPNPFTENKETRPAPSGNEGRQGDKESGDATPNTQHPTPNTRLYRTGDLARYRADGKVEFLGRIDAQVKVRGFRIEPGEIEARLSRHPAVREAVVVAREDLPGDTRLVAYIVPKIEDRRLKIEDSNLSSSERLSSIFYPLSSELRGFLQEQLPDYMLPSVFVPLDALPLTANGKVDRSALPAPHGDRPMLIRAYVAPRTPMEETLAGLWAELLDIDRERVGVEDDFFTVGGHSLLATRVLARVRELFQVELPLRMVFEGTFTVAALARAIAQEQIKQAGAADLAALLTGLDQLSDDEVKALLFQ